MSNPETLAVVVERDIAFPPEKIWRALTQPHLIEEWLMKNDFKPAVDQRFNFRGDWGAAQQSLEDAYRENPSSRICILFAQVARGRGDEVVLGWDLVGV